MCVSEPPFCQSCLSACEAREGGDFVPEIAVDDFDHVVSVEPNRQCWSGSKPASALASLVAFGAVVLWLIALSSTVRRL